jgi:hypothetical protein
LEKLNNISLGWKDLKYDYDIIAKFNKFYHLVLFDPYKAFIRD